TADIHQSRRWACLIPAVGQPLGLTHRIEPHIARMVPGDVTEYSTHGEFERGIHNMLSGLSHVAMEYSHLNAIPVISKVDAGTIELVTSSGVEVVSSGALIAHLEARLTQEQQQSAIRAGHAVREVMMNAFALIADRVRSGTTVTEYDVQRAILEEFEKRGMETDHPPIVGAGPNSANPHYEPTAATSEVIRNGDFVLIDLWAREKGADTVFGDITWTGFVGETIPDEYEVVFDVVRDARDAAFVRVKSAMAASEAITGADLDDAARAVIVDAGYGEYFVHRTGHSITTELHGAGANLDNYETRDTRPILRSTSFSIEPGIYLPGRFGIRSELDVVITDEGEVIATSDPVQQQIIAILGERN
ncbi:MAG: M24 family metallopeptidase, partial [bacterium]|nr:M24 family metallopeptidase [Candidatus Kapabacteria bacterium]